MTLFCAPPPTEAHKFRAYVDQVADSEVCFDAYERGWRDTEDE
jgi:hypothetical protein